MKVITFEIKSILKFELDMVSYPELSSPKRWVQRGIDVLKKRTPGILRYLSRQKIMSELSECIIRIETPRRVSQGKMRRIFKLWIRKERLARLIMLVIEGIILPFTPLLALLPGPNVFFYIPALLFYYHFRSYRGLRRVDADNMELEIILLQPALPKK